MYRRYPQYGQNNYSNNSRVNMPHDNNSKNMNNNRSPDIQHKKAKYSGYRGRVETSDYSNNKSRENIQKKQNNNVYTNRSINQNKNAGTASKSQNSGLAAIIEKFVPESVYNSKTKKIFGLLTAEDLLLIALLFIFIDSDNDDSGLMCLAIIYLLLSDYIDLSGLMS